MILSNRPFKGKAGQAENTYNASIRFAFNHKKEDLKMYEKIAKKISLITTSFPWLICFLLILFFELRSKIEIRPVDTILALCLGLWTFISAFILKKRLDIDQESRRHRSYFLLAIIPGWIVILLPFWLLGANSALLEIIIFAVGISLVLLSNNLFYRISFHASINTSLFILLNHFTSWNYWFLFILIPVIGWSRYYLKKHTLFQLMAGAIVPIISYAILVTVMKVTIY